MTSITEAIDRIPAGGRIVAGACCGAPTSLLAGVAERSPGRNWSVWTGLLLDDGGIHEAVRAGDLELVSWHVSGAGRDLAAAGLIDYLPIRSSQLEKHLSAADLDAALVRITPPDAEGWCSVGPSAGFALTAIKSAKMCIAEVDDSLPRTLGQSRVHLSHFDILVPSMTDTPVYRKADIDDVSRAIARHVLDVLPDRPVLQLGIGAVTEALVAVLADEGVDRLRFVGMGMDAMVDLYERGLLENPSGGVPALESPDLVGTQRLMRFAHENPAVGVYPSVVAHSPVRLARYDRLISVNTAIEVDLSGQVNSEVIGGYQIAGIGGSIDFVEAATHSSGGMRIIAIPSTTRDGQRSRIVASLAANTTITIPRGMVDVVVTEYGIARLEGKTLYQRAEALAAIAAPQHRAGLAGEIARVAAR